MVLVLPPFSRLSGDHDLNFWLVGGRTSQTVSTFPFSAVQIILLCGRERVKRIELGHHVE